MPPLRGGDFKACGSIVLCNSLTSGFPWLGPIRFNSKKKFHLSSDLVLMVNKHIVVTASDPLNADLRAALLDTGNETVHHRSHFFLSLMIGSGGRVAIETKRRLFDPGVVQRSECIAFHHLAVHVWRCAPLNAAIRVNQERVSHAGFKGAAGRPYRKHAVQKTKERIPRNQCLLREFWGFGLVPRPYLLRPGVGHRIYVSVEVDELLDAFVVGSGERSKLVPRD